MDSVPADRLIRHLASIIADQAVQIAALRAQVEALKQQVQSQPAPQRDQDEAQ